MLTQFLERAVSQAARQPWQVLVAVAAAGPGLGCLCRHPFRHEHRYRLADLARYRMAAQRSGSQQGLPARRQQHGDCHRRQDAGTGRGCRDSAWPPRWPRTPGNFATAPRPDGGDFFDRNGLLFGSLADVRQTTQKLIDAQPLLGGLAYDPTLRGIANSLATAAGGRGRRSRRPGNRAISKQPLTGLHTAISAAACGQAGLFLVAASVLGQPGRSQTAAAPGHPGPAGL